jgi:hypothetical protein
MAACDRRTFCSSFPTVRDRRYKVLILYTLDVRA